MCAEVSAPPQVLRVLIDRSADGDHAEVKRLLERGDADTEAKTSESAFTAWNGHTEVIRLLVEHGANLEARNVDGYTPLMRAAINGRLDAITLLLTLGASTTATNDFSETALACAHKGRQTSKRPPRCSGHGSRRPQEWHCRQYM